MMSDDTEQRLQTEEPGHTPVSAAGDKCDDLIILFIDKMSADG